MFPETEHCRMTAPTLDPTVDFVAGTVAGTCQIMPCDDTLVGKLTQAVNIYRHRITNGRISVRYR